MELVADLANPFLALCVLTAALRLLRGFARGVFFVRVGSNLAFVYGFTSLDRRFGWWAGMGSDFSTHAATALVLVGALGALRWRWLFGFGPFLLGYFALIVGLGYHSVSDLVTTTALVLPVVAALHVVARRLETSGEQRA